MPRVKAKERAARVQKARRLWNAGYDVLAIAERMGVGHATASAYVGLVKQTTKVVMHKCPSCGMMATEVFPFWVDDGWRSGGKWRGVFCGESAPGKRDGCFCKEHLPPLDGIETLVFAESMLARAIDWTTDEERKSAKKSAARARLRRMDLT